MKLGRALAALALGLAAMATGAVAQRGPAPEHPAGEVRVTDLPPEAMATRMPNGGSPRAKLRVPSSGSTIQQSSPRRS